MGTVAMKQKLLLQGCCPLSLPVLYLKPEIQLLYCVLDVRRSFKDINSLEVKLSSLKADVSDSVASIPGRTEDGLVKEASDSAANEYNVSTQPSLSKHGPSKSTSDASEQPLLQRVLVFSIIIHYYSCITVVFYIDLIIVTTLWSSTTNL